MSEHDPSVPWYVPPEPHVSSSFPDSVYPLAHSYLQMPFRADEHDVTDINGGGAGAAPQCPASNAHVSGAPDHVPKLTSLASHVRNVEPDAIMYPAEHENGDATDPMVREYDGMFPLVGVLSAGQ